MNYLCNVQVIAVKQKFLQGSQSRKMCYGHENENMLETHRLSQTKYSLLPVKQDAVCLDISTHIHAFIKYTIRFYNSTWTCHSDLSILNLLNTLNLLLKEFP